MSFVLELVKLTCCRRRTWMERSSILDVTFASSISHSLVPRYAGRPFHRVTCALLVTIGIALCPQCRAQDSLPFQVLNPKHQKWSPEEANRIYLSACALVARAIRPENPPQLRPRFVVVLGAASDQTIRNGTVAEVHLRTWSPEAFAEAAVIMATREVLQSDQMKHLTHEVLLAARASVTVNELKQAH
jgi:hypothetical protein